ncbi:PaaI family thioesterase [Polymorphobacter sp. PAMC 29334]|uniref:PaaI family thioesterase n=1 Tax=Polymorphobacter sp. PAMC 29334 TaxID=2862331 RepID=UPI001C76FC3D|nr:PaaI family thioesterase [Polymorphobacter sp. PAMC 29334]QYE36038.1 PaaI family thioesterase [Polymorphobacter sp. PAMC 29334]
MSLEPMRDLLRSERGTLDVLPYPALLGLTFERDGDEVRLRLPFDPALIGSPERLHGGVVAGLLEFAGLAALLLALPDDAPLPRLKPLTATVDYLRAGGMRDTFAVATVMRLGRRVANLTAVAWQYDHSRPIATAKLNIILSAVSESEPAG